MAKFNVYEKFSSIDGEGPNSGKLSTFIRFVNCNLRCPFCDTKYALTEECTHTVETEKEIVDYCIAQGNHNITLTGGEPLLQPNLIRLVNELIENKFYVSIETNGSLDFSDFPDTDKCMIVMDYKCPSSGQEKAMLTSNFELLNEEDVVKFVVGDKKDLEEALKVIHLYQPICKIYVSPVFGDIELVEIVDFMKEHKLNDWTLQAQLQKIAWSPETRGV